MLKVTKLLYEVDMFIDVVVIYSFLLLAEFARRKPKRKTPYQS